MKIIHSWKFQHNRNKFWTINTEALLLQLQSKNHTQLQAFDDQNKRIVKSSIYNPVTNKTAINATFTVAWNVDDLNPLLKNVPQIITGTVTDLPVDITFINPPQIEVWFMEYIPKAGEEPWIKPPTKLPTKPLTVIHTNTFLNPDYFSIEGHSGFRVIHLPHLKPIFFPTLSTITPGVSVIVDPNQRVIQIDTNAFEGSKQLCKLKIVCTSGYSSPKFSYIRPWQKPKGQLIKVYELAENDVPILFGLSGKTNNYTVDQWNSAMEIYVESQYKQLEITHILPPLKITNDLDLPPNCLVGVQSKLIKVELGHSWDDVEFPNPDPNSQWPTLTKQGVKRRFESRGAEVLFTSMNGQQVINLLSATIGNYNPDVPGIYQPVISVSFPDWPNTLNLFYKAWIVVQNEDGTDPPDVDDFYMVNSFENMILEIPQHYPVNLLNNLFGINLPFTPTLAPKGYFITDYKRDSCPIDWDSVEFFTDQPDDFEFVGSWVPRYPWIEPDVLLNPPKLVLHVMAKASTMPVMTNRDLPPIQPDFDLKS